MSDISLIERRHSYGPWHIDEANRSIVVKAGDKTVHHKDLLFAKLSDEERAEAFANGLLIAAAPEMLDVLFDIHAFLKGSGYDARLVESVIKQATLGSVKP